MVNKITIITVCFNAEKTIAETIESVLSQDYPIYQYIIVDGKSTDGTIRIINRYTSKFQEKGIRFVYYSEEDEGIFDAMNKGIKYASGDWVYFLNSDDTLYSQDTIKKVFSSDYEDVDCVYGDTVNKHGKQIYYRASLPIDVVTYRNPYVHQALFCKRGILEKYSFDTNYKYSADFDQCVRMYVDGISFRHISIPIALFSLEGRSQKDFRIGVKEFERIRKNNGIAGRDWLKRHMLYMAVFVIKGNIHVYRLYALIKKGVKE